MEHDVLSLAAMVLSLMLLMFMVMRILTKTMGRGLKLPPGPGGLPLIGNLHNLIGYGQPHHRLRDLANKYGPLMHLQLGECTTIVASTPEMAREFLKTRDATFAQRPPVFVAQVMYSFSDIAFAPHGDYWRQMKKICMQELLSARRVESFRYIREEEVSKLVKTISSNAGSVINVSKMFFALTFSLTSRAVFGEVVMKVKDEFRSIINEIVEAAGGFDIGDLYPSVKFLHRISGVRTKLEKLLLRIDKMMNDIINEHKARKSGSSEEVDDLVDVLVSIQQRGDLPFPLATDNIKAVILDMFIAGSHTVSTALDFAFSEVMKNPQVMRKAQVELRQVFDSEGNVKEESIHKLNYLKLIIKETLRLHPPAPLLVPHESMEHCQVNGFDIPVNSKVIVNAWAIGRDPEYWREPDKFIPERFIDSATDYSGKYFELIPFGSGRRICPGIHFGIANIELPLANLLYHFDWELSDGRSPQNVDMNEVFGAVVRRKFHLEAIPTPYVPTCHM